MSGTNVSQGKPKRTWLDRIESLGNKVPHPAMIFLGLCILVIVLSWVLAFFDVSVTYDVAEAPGTGQDAIEGGTQGIGTDYPDPDDVVIRQESTSIQSLLSIDGIRFIFTSFVTTSPTSASSPPSSWR